MDKGKLALLLEEIVGQQAIAVDEPMSAHTTFEIGGPADCFVRPRAAAHIKAVADLCRGEGVALHVMGRGSNLLVADAGVRGVVMQIADNLAEAGADRQGEILAQAGATNASVAAVALKAGLAGYEFASGIPGSIGGAAIMNAGAYGSEFSQVCKRLTCLTAEGDVILLDAQDAGFGYRRSRMSDEGMVVIAADLQLSFGDPAAIKARMDELARKRSSKQPLHLPSAGSTFKRPEGAYAGKVIQEAGMQGYRVGGAQVSEMHAGIVVNTGGATAADVLQLISDVQARVRATCGIELEPEIRMWGFADGATA